MELIENLQYGNSPGIDLHYSYAAILVKVPPFAKRTTTKASSV
jgi:hypothetical protein